MLIIQGVNLFLSQIESVLIDMETVLPLTQSAMRKKVKTKES
jgi:phenylacetate-coenzyme A ligase PaaK-like adenylate-forming protein